MATATSYIDLSLQVACTNEEYTVDPADYTALIKQLNIGETYKVTLIDNSAVSPSQRTVCFFFEIDETIGWKLNNSKEQDSVEKSNGIPPVQRYLWRKLTTDCELSQDRKIISVVQNDWVVISKLSLAKKVDRTSLELAREAKSSVPSHHEQVLTSKRNDSGMARKPTLDPLTTAVTSTVGVNHDKEPPILSAEAAQPNSSRLPVQQLFSDRYQSYTHKKQFPELNTDRHTLDETISEVPIAATAMSAQLTRLLSTLPDSFDYCKQDSPSSFTVPKEEIPEEAVSWQKQLKNTRASQNIRNQFILAISMLRRLHSASTVKCEKLTQLMGEGYSLRLRVDALRIYTLKMDSYSNSSKVTLSDENGATDIYTITHNMKQAADKKRTDGSTKAGTL